MPYCELRFPNSPAQLMVSGLVGDIPTPAYLAFGAHISSFTFGANNYLQLALGRRSRSASGATLVSGTADAGVAVLDSASYGGHYHQLTAAIVGSAGGDGPVPLSPTTASVLGVYHVLTRALTANATFGQVAVVASGETQKAPFDTGPFFEDYTGPLTFGFAAQNVWTTLDAGQIGAPIFPRGALTDFAQTYTILGPWFYDQAASHAALNYNWTLLLPIDGSLLLGKLIPDGLVFPFGPWVWVYVDGLGVNLSSGVGAGASNESQALPAPNNAGGAPGSYNANDSNVHVNLTSDPYLTLDPTCAAGSSVGVNQLAGVITDQVCGVYSLVCELQYAPLYLTLR
jgi:hypothetical protein